MSSHRRSQAGLTRVETLLIAGTGLLLLLLAGVPAGPESDEGRLATGQATVDSAFQLARALAQSTGMPHGVVLDVDGDRLAVIDADGRLADAGDDVPVLVDLAALGVDIVQADYGRGGRTAIYDRDGVPLAAGTLVLASGEMRMTLGLDAATGFMERRLE